jgi:hypothetical protein
MNTETKRPQYDGNVKRRRVKRFKHDLHHLFAVGFRVQGGLGE